MNNSPLKRKPLARWVAFALAATTVAGVVQAAAPLAGTEIKNLATVSYEDENGNKYTAQSNEAIITVAPQYRATLENDKEITAAAGQTVYFPHTLKNIGNIEDTYALTTTAVDKAGVDVNSAIKIFKDTNSNGQPDAGEPEITDLTLVAGETGSIIIAYSIPVTATDTDTVDIKLTATSAKTGAIVKDSGLNGDNDTDDSAATNDDKIIVGSGPILVLNKESVVDEVNKKITYTLTVKNTGGATATNVDILDVLPKVDTNGDGTLDTYTTLVAGSIVTNGLLDANDVVATATDEATLQADINADGLQDAPVIRALDVSLAPNTTVSIEYAINYDDTWAAGANIENQFTAFEDPNNDHLPANPANTPISNKTHNEVPQNYGVIATDGDTSSSPNINNGGDDNTDVNSDGTGDDDIQFVDTISSGDTVVFTHTIENTGNGSDTFNLIIANNDFPAGTVFTFWNEDGTVQLTDSDGDNVPDTGVIAQGTSKKIVVKADLPSGESKIGTASTATLTATSSTDPATAGNKASDDTTLTLGQITAPAVDLAAKSASQPDDGFNDGGTENAHNEGPVLLKDGLVGGTVVFPMTVANEAGSADSFLLGFDKLPDGWSVIFKDANGNTITSTPFIPAGGTFDYDAIVTISSAPSLALASSDRAADVDGHDKTNDNTTNLVDTDGDKDYVIDFSVTSAVDATRKDTISHAVDVADVKSIEITPDGQNQVQPGGTVDFLHKLSNNGNVDEAVELTSSNSDPDWNSRTLIKTSTGDLVELSNLKPGDTIVVNNPDGSTSNVVLTDTDGDGKVEFPLKPGQYINIINKAFGPSDASQGGVNTTTLTVTDPDVAETVRGSAKDTSNVILGQVRLTKTVALDADCNGEADDATSFAAIQTTKVAPGQCATWKIVAKNEGDVIVKNVMINDTVPAYTAFLANSFRVFDNAGVAVTPTSDAIGDDVAEIDNTLGKVTYYIGANPDPANTKGGELQAGETSTVYFTVKIDG